MVGLNRREFLGCASAAAAGGILPDFARAANAATIYINGRIHTMSATRPLVQALAVREGRIIAAGSNEDARAAAGRDAILIDLQGLTVIPGLNDSHIHFVRGSLSYALDVRWDGVRSLDQALSKLKDQAARTPPGQWVRVGGGWSEFQFEEKRLPTLDELNAAVPDHPLYVLHFYERSFVNKVGLKALGMKAGSTPLAGGEIQRDASGAPTGLLLARPLPATVLQPESKMPSLSMEDAESSVRGFMRELNRRGLTSLIDPGGVGQPYPGMYQAIQGLAAKGAQTVRLALYLLPQMKGSELSDVKTWIQTIRLNTDEHWLRIVGAGELLLQDMTDWDLYTSPPVSIDDTLATPLGQVVKALFDGGWSMRQHATFDKTVEIYLNAVEAAKKAAPTSPSRFAVDHAELISERSLARIAKLGGGVAVQHRAAFHGELGSALFGSNALNNAPPIRKMVSLGIPVGAGTDATRDTTYNPWVCITWMVTGKTVGGTKLLSDDNCVDISTAIRLYTAGSAWFSGEESVKGTLETGRFADFAVLSQDVFSIEPDELWKTESVLTVVGGKPVFGQGAFDGMSPAPELVTPAWAPPRHQSDFAGTADKN